MPAASLLLPLLARLLRLIPSVLALLPVRPPPAPSHSSLLSPHSFHPPPFVPRRPPCALGRPPFAVGRSPFVVSPSASSGQALSNHERPLHRPAYPNLLALPPSYRRPPVFRLWAPTRPNRGPADPAPRQPAPQKIRQISRPLARLPLWGSRASGREYPKNPHRNHRRLPLPCRWKPASSLAPACTVPPQENTPLRPTRQSGVRGEPALSLPKEPGIQSSLSLPKEPPACKGNPVFIPRQKNPAKVHPAPPQEFFGKNSYTREHTPNRPATPHPPQPPFVRFRGPNLESATT